MKERPILFSAPMVRAILDGRKTQTRRVVKPHAWWSPDGSVLRSDPCPVGYVPWWNVGGIGGERFNCPFGQPGDRLWVRETWAAVHFSIDPETGFADDWHGSHDIPPGDGGGYWSKLYAADSHPTDKEDRGFAWRPSIHMPRWASRITLEVTGVRVERLQDISEADAKAEGLKGVTKDGSLVKYGIPDRDGWPGVDDDGWPWQKWCTDPRGAFFQLWESINGPGSWDANPWVWVVEFRRL